MFPPSSPQVAFTPDGDALAVWIAQEQHGLTDQHAPAYIGQMHASRYAPGIGWSAERSIDVVAGSAYAPQMVPDATGYALAVWVESSHDATPQWLYTNRYSITHGWGEATRLASDGIISNPQVAFDPAGNALAVWNGWSLQAGVATQPPQTYATRYVAGRSWIGSNENIDICGRAATARNYPICTEEAFGPLVFGPQLGVDAEGNAIAVWLEQDGPLPTRLKVYANRYVAASHTWDEPRALSTDAVMGPVGLTVERTGDAWVIWSSGGQIRVSRYTPAAGWADAQSIAAGVAQTYFGQTILVAADSNGNALAVWTNTAAFRSASASRYTPAAGWGAPLRIDCSDPNLADGATACPSGGVSDLSVAFDSAGNAFAVWSYAEVPQPYHNELYRQGQIYANHYSVTDGWSVPQSIDIRAGAASHPKIAVDPVGRALAIWTENGHIYVNRFE